VKLRRLHTFLSVLNASVDPFTTEDIEIVLTNVSRQIGGAFTESECSELYREYIGEPSRLRRSEL
jgi:hypothetical protein